MNFFSQKKISNEKIEIHLDPIKTPRFVYRTNHLNSLNSNFHTSFASTLPKHNAYDSVKKVIIYSLFNYIVNYPSKDTLPSPF
jgi:hypothetical protein